jgi:hypothetical protein
MIRTGRYTEITQKSETKLTTRSDLMMRDLRANSGLEM